MLGREEHGKPTPFGGGFLTAVKDPSVSTAPQAPSDVNKLGLSKKSGLASLVSGFFFWYSANVAFNIVNKQALLLFPHAWTVSVVQLSAVITCSASGWATGKIAPPWKGLNKGLLLRLLPPAFCHALGNGLTSEAFSRSSVSFTHVVKTSEPVWMALGNYLLNGLTLPWAHFLALVPIMFGVALASAGEIAFSWVGFLAALASTICFAGRGILSKGLMSPDCNSLSPLNVYAMDSLLALLFTLPVAAISDGPSVRDTWDEITAHESHRLLLLLTSTGLAYYAYNAIAFELLDKLDVVSHAVGNLGKRIFVIGFSVLVFKTPLTPRAVVGSVTAIAGSGLYSYLKAGGGKGSSSSTRLKQSPA